MQNEGPYKSSYGLDKLGISGAKTVYWNLPPARLVELAIQRGEAQLAAEGPLVCRTGQHTGRSPNDRFVVRDGSAFASPVSSATITHWGNWNELNSAGGRKVPLPLPRSTDTVPE